MTKHRFLTLMLVTAMLVTGLLPSAVAAGSMPAAPASPSQVNVAGSFEESLGGSNWSNNDPLTDMADANADGVWKFTATLPGAGDYEYKIVEDANWDLSYPADNVAFSVAAGQEVRWYYDENDHYVADSTNQVIAAVVGNFVEAIGGQNWAPDNLKTLMRGPDADNVYTYVAVAVPEGNWEYKVALDEGWTVSYPSNNVAFSVPAGGSDVTFYYDADTNDVWQEVGGAPPPLLVTFPGSWPEAAGLGNNWDPGNLQTQANDDNGDGVWRFETDQIPAGSYEFKAAVGGTWDENYGVNGVPGGDNVQFTADGGPVVFYYDRDGGDNFVASRPNYIIPVVAGSFVGAIGGQDWTPSNLRTWMKDPDGDGIYTFSATVPEGTWEYKVALNEGWDVAYPPDNRSFTVPAGGAQVVFSYDSATNAVSEEIMGGVPDEDLVRDALQSPIQDEVLYFVMTDRFQNGDTANDEGAFPGGTLAQTGFLPEDKAFYHGGDLRGLQDRLDYIQNLGATAIWVTPVFANQATQPDSGTDYGFAGAYHGYWILDYENADAHLGTDAELQTFIDDAHSRGIKVYFDIVVNHTADVIDYAEGSNVYRNKTDYPYLDANGDPFDDRDYAGTGTFPELDPAISFPYTPIFPELGDETAKNPAWLNNPIYYHNRGDSTFAGESSQYGDFFGLDDTFTEHPDVVAGYIDIFTNLIDTYDIDGYRIDTVKHVNMELWQELVPEVLAYAQSVGKEDFGFFGEAFDGNPAFTSLYTTDGKLPSVLDFGLQGAIGSVGIYGSPTDVLRDFFASDDYYTDADSNAYALATFVSNHDTGRAGYALRQALSGASDEEQVTRMKWGYAMLFFARGFPVIYYGDEQGFVGGGSDKLSREDMLPSLVPEYMNNDLIGTDATPADANFDETHPLYQALAEFAQIRQDNLALRRGAQIHRFSTDSPGIYAFSRIEREEQVEYVVAFNSATTAQQATFPTYLADTEYTAVYPAGAPALMTNANAEITVNLDPGAVAVYKASSPLPPSDGAPGVTFTVPAPGGDLLDRAEIGVDLGSDQLAEVTFAVQPAGGDWEVIGTDTNPPYRVFYDVSTMDPGTSLTFRAIANDLNGHLSSATTTAVVGEPPVAGGPRYAIMHYYRSDGDYGDHTTGNYEDYWGLHLWGDAIDPSEVTDWTNPKPFLGEDDYGRFAWIKLADPSMPVNFIVHRGNVKDGTDADRSFNPTEDGPEVWIKQDDANFYLSQADAQGYVTVHYHRPDGDYGDYTSNDYNDFWGLHLWTDLGGLTGWTEPKKADGIDDYGAYFTIALADYPGVLDFSLPLNFIVHRGDDKDPPNSPDRSFMPQDTADIWLQSGDEAVYNQRGGAENFALLHYRRDAGDYGDYTSANYNDFWGMHVWLDTTNNVQWTDPLRPVDQDLFGVTFKVDLTEDAQQIGYIFHRGDEKDPGPDQFLMFADKGYQVWQLQGADPEDPYILPVPAVSGGSAGNIGEQRAYWVLDDTIAWSEGDSAANTYTLHYAPEGGLEATPDGITGGDFITLSRDPAGLPLEVQEKFPHLADLPALKIDPADLDLVPEILKGQIAVSAVNAEGVSQGATGLQIPGVLDDLYTYEGDLGLAWDSGVPIIRVWAPTAKSVTFHLFDDSDPATTSTTYPMAPDPATGVWSVTGEAGWKGKYYLYEVEVFVHSTGQVEHNMVTDPYSLSLAMNSTRSQLVDLSDLDLAPAGWDGVQKPALVSPEEISIYEIHVRDFSVNDPTVPDEYKGTYKAFTLPDTNGINHLRALQEAGLTHLHLLPVFDIATIDENKAEWMGPSFDELSQYGPDAQDQQALITATADQDAFNWGYDPWHFTTPEGSYATNPDGTTRIVEFRGMVEALNNLGLRVVMDVVYNHTNSSGQSPKSVFDRIVPGYYHRLDDRGQVETSTCCQNTASEHNMMEKFMVDSLLTWAKDYKIDAFRFDLMGHHMKRNMLRIREALDGLTLENDGVDGRSIYMYGEGWNFGEVADNARGVNATQLNMAGTGIGTFSDRLRDAVRGGGPFDSGQDLIRRQGFANGLYYDPNALNSGSQAELDTLLLTMDQIRVGLAGNLADYQFVDRNGDLVTGADVDYNGQPAGYTDDPQEVITYVSKHDNQTLYDNNVYKTPLGASMLDRVRIQNVALSTAMLGEGVHFFHAGSDLLRSKSLDRDSYNSGDWFNRLDFTYQANNFGVGLPVEGVNGDNWTIMQPLLADTGLQPGMDEIYFSAQLYQELLAIHQSSPLFRLETAQEIQDRLAFHNTGPNQVPGLIVMSISDEVEPDLDPAMELIVVLFNANDEAQDFTVEALAGRSLSLNPVQANSADPLVRGASFDPATGTFSVPGRTTAVFAQLEPVTGAVTQTANTSPAVHGTTVEVDVSLTNNLPMAIYDFFAVVPLDDDVSYVMGSAFGGGTPLTAGYAAQLAQERGDQSLAALAADHAPDDVVAVAYLGAVASGETVDFGFAARITSYEGQVLHSVAVFDGATLLLAIGSDPLTIVDNRDYPIARSQRFDLTMDSMIQGVRPTTNFGSEQTTWVGFFDYTRPVVYAPVAGIPNDAAIDVGYLYLYVVEKRGGNEVMEVSAHPALTPWDEGTVTWWWPWSSQGGDLGPAGPASSLGPGRVGTWLRLNITDAAEEMVRSGSTDGLILTSDSTGATRYAFATREHWSGNVGYVRVMYRTAD